MRVGGPWYGLLSVAAVALVGLHASPGSGAASKPEYDGTVRVALSVSDHVSGIYSASDPSTERQTETLRWVASETVAVYGLKAGTPQFVAVGGPRLVVTGSITTAAAAPNQALSCDGSLSARSGAKLAALFRFQPGGAPDRIWASSSYVPTGDYVASTGAGPCRADPGGGLGVSVGIDPTNVATVMTDAEQPHAYFTLGGTPVVQRFPPSGSPITGSTPTRSETFSATFTVGGACGAAGAHGAAVGVDCCADASDEALLAEAEAEMEPEGQPSKVQPFHGLVLEQKFQLKAQGKAIRAQGGTRPRQVAKLELLKAGYDARTTALADRWRAWINSTESTFLSRARCAAAQNKIRELGDTGRFQLESTVDELDGYFDAIRKALADGCTCHFNRPDVAPAAHRRGAGARRRASWQSVAVRARGVAQPAGGSAGGGTPTPIGGMP